MNDDSHIRAFQGLFLGMILGGLIWWGIIKTALYLITLLKW